MSEYKGVPPHCDTWQDILWFDICKIISKNSGSCRWEEPDGDDPFIDFYCELDAYMIDQPTLGIEGYEEADE